MINKELQRKCAKCGVTPLEDSSLSFHRFPLPTQRGSLKARVWAQYCFPDRDWSSDESLKYLYNQHKTLCSKHFDDSSYTSSARSRLNCFAIPFDAQSLLKSLKNEIFGKVPQFNELPCPSRVEYVPTSTESTCSSVWPQESAKKLAGTSIEMIEKKTTVHTVNVTAQQLDIAAVGDIGDKVPHFDKESTVIETEEADVSNYTPKENVFSWEVTSDAVSIRQDEPEQLDDDRDDLSMYCDDDTARDINRTGLHEGFHCNNCNGDIVGYRYTCVQCCELDLCTSCESSGAHAQHYMLRVPGPRPYNEIQSVLRRIRKLLMKDFDPISAVDLDDEDTVSLKSEIKSEDEKENVEDTEEIDDITEDAVEPETEELSRPTSPEPQYSENANCDVIMENNVPVKQQLNILDTSLINEQENQKPLVESTDNRESTVANTAKRKLVVRLSDCVKLNLYNQFGKKLCVAPSISKQDIKETNTILCNRTVLDHSKVKYVRLAPSVLLNRGQTVPLQILSPWKPQTNSADGNS